MGKRYPALDREQIEAVLKQLNFELKKTKASHSHWEGYVKGQRRLVTVDRLKSKTEKYGYTLLKSMIDQSGLTKKEFYSYL